MSIRVRVHARGALGTTGRLEEAGRVERPDDDGLAALHPQHRLPIAREVKVDEPRLGFDRV
jgi:hypothetical protein